MYAKYYGLPYNQEHLRSFIKNETGILITKTRAKRMFELYKEAQEHPIMANSFFEKLSAKDLLLLSRAGLLFPMKAKISLNNIKEYMLNHLEY